MGFLFFTPIYIPGTKIKVYAPVHYENEPLEYVMGGQLAYRYFPVRHAELASEIKYFDLKEGRFNRSIALPLHYIPIKSTENIAGKRLMFSFSKISF